MCPLLASCVDNFLRSQSNAVVDDLHTGIARAHGDLLGAIGVTGDTSDNDELCAVAAVEAAGLRAVTG